jgi:hypothetical protein
MKAGAYLREATLFLVAMNCPGIVRAASLVTLQNSTLSVPAAGIVWAGLPGATNLVGSNFMLSAVAPSTLRGGRASLANSQRWVQRYNGGPASFQNAPAGVVVRSDGSVVVTGYSVGPGTDYDFVTISYAADGCPLWTNRYDGPGHGRDSASLLATDPNGNVWVAGDSMRYATNFTLTDVAMIKYASNGTPLWTNRYSSFETNGTYPTALIVDGSGNAYLEQLAVYWQSAIGSPVEDSLIKCDALGNVVWTRHYFRAAPDSGQDLHDLGPMALDGAGNLFVAGTTGSEHWDTGSAIVKFAGNGTALWTNHHPFPFLYGINLLSADRQGNAIVTGESFSNGNVAYVILKCSAEGASLWTNVVAGPRYDGGNVPQTVSDAAGNVFVIGGSPGTLPGFYRIVKVSSSGIPLWTNQTADFGPVNSMVGSSAVDSAGNLYLAGHAPASGRGDLDYVTVKYSGEGQPLWTNRFNGTSDRDDIPFALAVDSAGNVYVAGASESQAGNWDFATVKYADLLFYSPPKDFIGLDSIPCTLTDNTGNRATGSVDVAVVAGLFSLSPAATKLTPAGLQFQADGVPGTNAVILETSLDLISWRPVLTNAPDHGSVQFLDPAALNLPRRFYRALQEQ